MPGGADIGIVIAGNDADAVRRADALQPRLRRREFCFQRQVDQIAGDRDVVRLLRLQVRDQRIEHLAAMEFLPVALPVEIAERAFAREIAQAARRQRRQMRIGQMGQRECRHHGGSAGYCARKRLYDHLAISGEILQCIGKPAGATQGSNGRITTSEYAGCRMAMSLQDLRKRLEPVLRRIFHFYWRFARGMTLGVRAVVLDGDNRVFLVKHSYVSGWHLPGGGVEVGESFRDALAREVMEEGRIEVLGEPALHGLFFNSHVSRRDHVAVYVVRRFDRIGCPSPTARSSPAVSSRDRAAGGDHRGHAAADIGGARRQGADRDWR